MSQWPEITTEQIVTRLRATGGLDAALMERAAREIERLRDERAARIDELVRNTDEFRETLTDLRREVETLTAERDAAIRELRKVEEGRNAR